MAEVAADTAARGLRCGAAVVIVVHLEVAHRATRCTLRLRSALDPQDLGDGGAVVVGRPAWSAARGHEPLVYSGSVELLYAQPALAAHAPSFPGILSLTGSAGGGLGPTAPELPRVALPPARRARPACVPLSPRTLVSEGFTANVPVAGTRRLIGYEARHFVRLAMKVTPAQPWVRHPACVARRRRLSLLRLRMPHLLDGLARAAPGAGVQLERTSSTVAHVGSFTADQSPGRWPVAGLTYLSE